MQIGIVGLGKMGLAMAERLAVTGSPVIGWDLDPARMATIAQTGGTAARDLRDLAARTDAVITIVTDDAAVTSLFEHEQGLLGGDCSGKLFIEMSTVRPETIRRVGVAASRSGAKLVGAPVLGSIPTVRDGKLLVLAGGSAEDIDACRTVLSPLARSVLALGPLGAGNAMKLVANLTMAAYLEALAEGLALGLGQGLDLDTMLQVLGEAPTANAWLASKVPVLRGGPPAPTLDIAALHKDVLAAVATGAADGLAMPLAAGVLTTLAAATSAGFANEDVAQLPAFYRQHMVRQQSRDALPKIAG